MFWNIIIAVGLLVVGGLGGAALTAWLRARRASDTSFDSFKNQAAGIQSYIFTLAVVIGGGWTFYTFVAKDVLKLYEEAQINVQVEAQQEKTPAKPMEGCGQFWVTATVRITNTGKRDVALNYVGDGDALDYETHFPLTIER